MRRVLKWAVPVDDDVTFVGPGRVVNAAMQHGAIVLWTDETESPVVADRPTRVFGTGHTVPDDAEHLGSVVDGSYVWHVFEVAP